MNEIKKSSKEINQFKEYDYEGYCHKEPDNEEHDNKEFDNEEFDNGQNDDEKNDDAYGYDTIAAIATGLTDSGIGIIRISGPEAVSIGNKIFRLPNGKEFIKNAESHILQYGYVVENKKYKENKECNESYKWNDNKEENNEIKEEKRIKENKENKDNKENKENKKDKVNKEVKCITNNINKKENSKPEIEEKKDSVIDEVMAVVMRSPRSYTGEDTVEIQCHGGVFVMKKILETVLKWGARMAEPGEFTKRAFLNGRIDLSRAEAVMDVIQSQNEAALSSSIGQLKGILSEKIKQLRSEIIYEIAYIEAALDDPEHINLEGYPQRLLSKTEKLREKIRSMILTADDGRFIKEGINTVIIGKPNVGKSSFLNRLLGEERAIVTDVAGTTRDILRENIRLGDVSLNIVDTAGIRSTEDTVEKIGVEKTKSYAGKADLILYIVDSSMELDENDIDIIELTKEKKRIIILNKSDLKNRVTEEEMGKFITENTYIIRTSMKDGSGMEEFERTVKNMFFHGEIGSNSEIIITNIRHKTNLQEAYDALSLVKKSIEEGMPEDFYSIDLMNAYASLGRVIGEEVDDDLVEEIFSKFCMGK